MIENIQQLQRQIKERKPLIHCITNPISIHDCANVILAAGGRPIMAEHPVEVEEITSMAESLMLNLGNITDVRMESMKIALKTAQKKGIPVLLDLVGVACSKLRMEYAKELMKEGSVSILKGNMSEILAIAGEPSHSIGIDAGREDAIDSGNLNRIVKIFRRLSDETGAVILASGKEDLIVDGEKAYLISNGDPMLSDITGTGCMLGALCSAYLAAGRDRSTAAAILGTVSMGIAGELAAKDCPGTGTFQVRLLDCLYGLDEAVLEGEIRIREL